MAQWLMDNGIAVHRTTADVTWNGQTFPQNSYVVWMDQALRGIALTALSVGQDVSDRITRLYAPPGAWSHGSLWGANVVEVPRGDASFDPATVPITTVNPLQGGVRNGGRRTGTRSRSREPRRSGPSWTCSGTASPARWPRSPSPTPRAARCLPVR
jgi:hypothetical protein